MKPNLMWRLLVIFVGVSGAFSVLFGAWLAHAGQHISADVVEKLHTAHFYQLTHTLALLAILLGLKRTWSKVLAVTSILFILGICAFSGSIYVKYLLDWQAIGMLAPYGGVSMALAWLSLIFYAMRTQE